MASPRLWKGISKSCSFCKYRYIHEKLVPDILPSSKVIRIRKKSQQKVAEKKMILPPKTDPVVNEARDESDTSERRVNAMNIQMLSKNLFTQIFGTEPAPPDPETVAKCQAHLRHHGIDYESCSPGRDVKIDLPPLRGGDIVEHFQVIAEEQAAPYRILLTQLSISTLPDPPEEWLMSPGWHRYNADGSPEKVPYPPEDALVFDVEVLMSAGSEPTLACAVSSKYWYGWVSESLITGKRQKEYNVMEYESLIPLESDEKGVCNTREKPRIVVGHNVSFDRTKVKEQYWLERTGMRFMDTMSMHICVGGVTSYQRTVLMSKGKDPDLIDDTWMDVGSLNNLSDVHKLYVGYKVSKDPRDVFMTGAFPDVRAQFQSLMSYCASDVSATHRILVKLMPLMMERFPHPATLAGMLELGTSYLPVNSNWQRYIESSETTFEDLNLESRHLLSLKADEACRLMHNDCYKTDLWMWDQDWSTQTLKLKKTTKKKKPDVLDACDTNVIPKKNEIEYIDINNSRFPILNNEYLDSLTNSTETMKPEKLNDWRKKYDHLYKMKDLLPVKRPLLAGYPAWYRKLCNKPEKDENWIPGAQNVTTSMQITPKLLRLSWEGYPLYHHKMEGWGFLVPFAYSRPEDCEEDEPAIPLQELLDKCPVVDFEKSAGQEQSSATLEKIYVNVDHDQARRAYYARKKVDERASEHRYTGLGVWSGVSVQSCCHFLRLPHRDGPKYKVGNPLSKDFLDKFSQNVLSAQGNEAERVLNLGRMTSYWRNNRERILSQRVVWPPRDTLPPELRHCGLVGAILPQVIACGTLTRRAVEATWMTASNAQAERLGSELRAAVQAPPGYRLVGADVDSQELWVASLLGDSVCGIAGGTALGWAVLAGSKAAGTDMHSLTARAAGVSRDHAKVINYARIYGAGQNFAERLLKQFNPTMSNSEAKSKAAKMFASTKGRRVYQIKPEFVDHFTEDGFNEPCEMSTWQAMRLAKLSGRRLEEMFERPRWVGGTESEMFNKLEEIADNPAPATAFLSGRLSRALERSEGRWASTRLNWAVQSAAADFLHLMLVSMRWLAPASARFCLSFHDEVRYLTPEHDSIDTALALHLTNLLTRAFCAQRVGIKDLPMSVAFFTSVEVDRVLRKESNLDCRTPSNPHGLEKGYGIPNGESLDIFKVIDKINARIEKKLK